MVSDYKFHLFCKRLKKEKWRLGKDLSLAMMLMIFHCCLRMSHPWEPGVGCTELPARSLSPGSPPGCKAPGIPTDTATDAPACAHPAMSSLCCLPHVPCTSAPSQAPLLAPTSLQARFTACKARLTLAEQEI